MKKNNDFLTILLIGLNVLFFLYEIKTQGSLNIQSNTLRKLGANNGYAVFNNHEYFRLISSMFLHANIEHITANMITFYFAGTILERSHGKTVLFIVYFFSGIVGSITSALMSNSLSVGASGAIFGVLSSVMIFSLTDKYKFAKGVFPTFALMIAINIVYSFTGNIDMFAHFGGLIAGASISLLISLLIKLFSKNNII